jgi:ABC-type amino acid transport system permease subunit
MTPLAAIRWVFLPKEVFLLAAAIYLAMSLPIAFLTRRLEARFARGQAHV